MSRAGTCEQLPQTSVTLMFGADSSFVVKLGYLGAVSTYAASFDEPVLGSMAVIAKSDTATVVDGKLRVRLTSLMCGREDFVATRD